MASPPVFYTQQGSALYLVSHRMTISMNIHLLRPVFTIQGYTGLKVKNILSRFFAATKWKKSSRKYYVFYISVGGLCKVRTGWRRMADREMRMIKCG